MLETWERMRIEGLAEGSSFSFSKWLKSKMATALRPCQTSSRPISREPAVGAAREQMQIEGLAKGSSFSFSKWPKSKMATALRPHRTSSRPISLEPAVGAAREWMQIEGLAEGSSLLFSKWPKSKMATALRPHRTSSWSINRQPSTGSARCSVRRKEDEILFPTRPSLFSSARFRFPSIFTGFSPQKMIELTAQ